MPEFTATLYKVGNNRCVDVPARIVRGMGKSKYIPVCVHLAGETAETTVVPAGQGGHRVFVNRRLCAAAGADVGDEICLTIRRDHESREPTVPEDLRRALMQDRVAREVFADLTVNQRREFVRYIELARSVATRERRLATGLDLLRKRRR